MLISGYALQIVKPKCNVFVETNHANALLTEDLSAILPYVNAAVPRCRYFPHAPALNLDFQGHEVILWPREIALHACQDEAEARGVLDALCAWLNDLWERRDTLEPKHEGFEPLAPLEAFQLLPGTNCGECGEPSCLAFALKLVGGETPVEACEVLLQEDHEDAAKALAAKLAARGYVLPEKAR